LLFAVVYVGSIYLSKNSRLSFSGKTVYTENGRARLKERDEKWRDDPDVIKARLAAVGFATLLCCLGVAGIVGLYVGDIDNNTWITLESSIARLGLTFDGISLWPYFVTPILFLGPIYTQYLSQALPFQQGWSIQHNVIPIFLSWQGVRNYVFAPITEELVFRACVLSVYQLSGASMTRMIFLSPMSFGAAHIHHAWDIFNRYGRTAAAARRALLTTLFQFMYTSLFGSYCCYLFIRTGSVFPPIIAHSFCNVMGLPQIGAELQQWPQKKFAIIAAYLIGIASFIYALGPWTYSTGSLYWMRLTLEKDRAVNNQGQIPFY
jgi:prenyl protein peptidase